MGKSLLIFNRPAQLEELLQNTQLGKDLEDVLDVVLSTWLTFSTTNWASLVYDSVYRTYEGIYEPDGDFQDYVEELSEVVVENGVLFEEQFRRWLAHTDPSQVEVLCQGQRELWLKIDTTE